MPDPIIAPVIAANPPPVDQAAVSPETKRDDKGRFVPKAQAPQAATTAPEPVQEAQQPEPQAEQPAALEIDEQTRRALLSVGGFRDDEDIRSFVQDVGPERAQRAFDKARETRVALGQRFAALGQTYAASQQPVAQQQFHPQSNGYSNGAAPGVTPGGGYIPTLEKFRESSMPEETVDLVLKPLQHLASRLEALESIRPVAMQAHDYVQRQQAEEARRTLASFLHTAGPMGAELYGKSIGAGSPAQAENLAKLWQTADRILLGAQAQNEPMTPADALALAHDMVSAPYAHEQARRQIQSQVQDRQRQFTPRPTSGAAPPAPSGRSRAIDALKEVEERHGLNGYFTGQR